MLRIVFLFSLGVALAQADLRETQQLQTLTISTIGLCDGCGGGR